MDRETLVADLAELRALQARLIAEREAAPTRKERRALSQRIKLTRALIDWRKDALGRFPKLVRVIVDPANPDVPDRVY